MRNIVESRRFKRDKKRIERSGRYKEAMKKKFEPAALANDEVLELHLDRLNTHSEALGL